MLLEQNSIFTNSEWFKITKELALSTRQSQILRSLFAGHSDKQIATNLNISIPTVRTHLTRLFRKFNVDDREELILYIFSYFRGECKKLHCPRKQ